MTKLEEERRERPVKITITRVRKAANRFQGLLTALVAAASIVGFLPLADQLASNGFSLAAVVIGGAIGIPLALAGIRVLPFSSRKQRRDEFRIVLQEQPEDDVLLKRDADHFADAVGYLAKRQGPHLVG
ncbi:hypothetical protein P3H15_27135 [Rhodococcus sp. T2V]|uniref:hypothetical protein n=1 Tax=Rhodococcus sp. T2V TaxID=3034164 RepID=UPI0023E1753B|nr:hypothetical protein [Rhodococcus sp. T2V]MDF3308696.1 hypothetical protein [Rhodococcus sp. T2V]